MKRSLPSRVRRPAPRRAPLSLLALVLVLLVACVSLPWRSPSIIKSPNDPRSYRALTLDNGLVVVLASDPTADKAAAALTVFRGSYDDPKDRPGLAHFLEHMLFLGTAKYPSVDGYQGYITTHGGTTNAYTASDHTSFFFDVQPDFFEGALDRFAQFFIAPTFDAAYVEREKNAVNSEYKLYLKDDGWRSSAVEKEVMNPAHPGARFSVGSLTTLAGDVRADLVAFYRTHYSADQMALVVIGSQSLDELQNWVRVKFSPIPRRTVAKPASTPPLFAPGTLPRKLVYRTVRNRRELVYNFPVPALDPYFREKPGAYVANLLGHEGVGSLHARLEARGWVEELSAGAVRYDADNALITVSIQLSDEGWKHQDDITRALFDYIALIRSSGLDEWRYQEQAEISDLAFRFQQRQAPLAFAYTTSPALQLYPVRDVLVAPYLMEHYDPNLIDRYLDALRPDNLLLEVSGPKVETDSVEPWFQVPYAQTPLGLDLGSPSPAEFGLALPLPNEFLPTNLELVEQPPSRPTRVDSTAAMSFWWAPDASFGTPRATTYVRLDVPGGLDSPTDAAYARLYARLVVDALNTFAYPAQIAGLGYDVGVQPGGFLITVSGYDDKQPLLLHRILDVFGRVEPTASKVSEYRDELLRSWQNFSARPPYEQAFASLSDVIIAGDWPPARLSDALRDVTPQGLAAWRHERLDHYDALVLVHGNVDAQKAKTVSQTIETTLKLAPVDVSPDRVARLPAGDFTFGLNARSDDAAMLLYLQGADRSFEERARFGLTAQVLRTPYYDDLRTQQQLGYVVAVAPSVLRRTPGLAFVVQSPVSGPGALLHATRTFLDGYRSKLAGMSADELSAYKQGLRSLLLEKDKNLADRSQRYWSDLDVGITSFDSREQIAARIDRIDLPDLMKFYDRLLELEQSRRLVIYSGGRFPDRPPGTPISDVGVFRAAVGVVTSEAVPRPSATP